MPAVFDMCKKNLGSEQSNNVTNVQIAVWNVRHDMLSILGRVMLSWRDYKCGQSFTSFRQFSGQMASTPLSNDYCDISDNHSVGSTERTIQHEILQFSLLFWMGVFISRHLELACPVEHWVAETLGTCKEQYLQITAWALINSPPESMPRFVFQQSLSVNCLWSINTKQWKKGYRSWLTSSENQEITCGYISCHPEPFQNGNKCHLL